MYIYSSLWRVNVAFSELSFLIISSECECVSFLFPIISRFLYIYIYINYIYIYIYIYIYVYIFLYIYIYIFIYQKT